MKKNSTSPFSSQTHASQRTLKKYVKHSVKRHFGPTPPHGRYLCFDAIEIKQSKPSALLIKIPFFRITSLNTGEQNEIITVHFKNHFFTNAQHMPDFEPTEMRLPFSREEIGKICEKTEVTREFERGVSSELYIHTSFCNNRNLSGDSGHFQP